MAPNTECEQGFSLSLSIKKNREGDITRITYLLNNSAGEGSKRPETSE